MKLYQVTRMGKQTRGIPKIIFRTHKTIEVCKSQYIYCHKEWIDKNPDYSMYWFTDSDCESILSSNDRIYKCYKKLNVGAFKADLWRVYMLYTYGGIYVDSYSQPLTSLTLIFSNCFKSKTENFLSVLDSDGIGIHNGFMVSTPKHPLLKDYLEKMVNNIENNYYGKHELDITGPLCFANTINFKLKIGYNNYKYPFYLLKFHYGPYQYISKNGLNVISKKYSFIEYIKQKVFGYSSTYKYIWKNQKVYKNNL